MLSLQISPFPLHLCISQISFNILIPIPLKKRASTKKWTARSSRPVWGPRTPNKNHLNSELPPLSPHGPQSFSLPAGPSPTVAFTSCSSISVALRARKGLGEGVTLKRWNARRNCHRKFGLRFGGWKGDVFPKLGSHPWFLVKSCGTTWYYCKQE